MNRPLRILYLVIVAAGFLTLGCNSPGNDKEDQAAILHHPPFAALTDSLSSAKGDLAAGLYFRRGELLSRNNLHELAADDYRKSWQLKPDQATGLRYASTLSIIGQTNRAVQLLQECHRKYPSEPAFDTMLAELYQQSNLLDEAVGLYNELLSRDSLNSDAWYEQGLVLEKKGDTAAAINALGRAFRLEPVNTYGLELAHLYAESHNSAALPICDAILRKDSAHELVDPLFIKGIYFSNTAQYRKAIVDFDSCIRRDWKFSDAYLEKGIAFYEQKLYDSAMNTFRMTVQVSNTDPDAYYWVGRCYEAKGQKDQAILFYRQALALDKDFVEAADRIRKLQ
jgi:tetratricopeptide (TPR) repeat protein